jgi:tetratricopeptide (TPR) repeat protein
LNDGVTGAHIWSETYTRDFDDIFAIESDIAMNVANALEAAFSLAEQQEIEKTLTDSPEAYRLYLRALQVEDEPRITYLSQAIAIDPEFARAYVQRGAVYTELLRVPGAEDRVAARRSERENLALQDLERALELDSSLGRAHAQLGFIHFANWRLAEANESYGRAVQLSPNDVEVLERSSNFMTFSGRHEEGVRLGQRAVALDPYLPAAHISLADGHFLSRQYALAAESYRQAMALDPADRRINLWAIRSLWFADNHAEAERNLRLSESYVLDQENLTFVSQLVYWYGRFGLRDDAERALSRFEEIASESRIPASARIAIALARGQNDEALALINAAGESKEPYEGFGMLTDIATNAHSDPVLDRPEFVVARQRLGLTYQ